MKSDMKKEKQIKNSLDLIIKILKDDLDEMLKKLEYSTYPIISTVCSGIDFIGGLIDGFKNGNSKSRSERFIKEFMGQVNSQYSEKGFAELFYSNIRSNLIHQIEAPGIWHGISKTPKYHLNIIDFDYFKSLFIHAVSLKDEFFKAVDLFNDRLNNNKEFKENVLYHFECAFTKEELLFYKKIEKIKIPIINIHSISDKDLEDMDTL